MANNDAEKKIGAIIAKIVRENTGLDVTLTSDQSLINEGILDSLSIVKVIQLLQNEYDVEISAGDITLENFDTISAITNFVTSRKG